MTDDLTLIERWRAGDSHAAEQLYGQHRDRVYRLAWGLLGNAEDAEEVAQDALTYALLNIDRYQSDRARFSTWLHTITVSRVRDRQRRKRFSLTSLTEWLQSGREPVDTQLGPEGHATQQALNQTVDAAVQALSPQLREAIVLRYWAQHSYSEIADIVGCPLGTAQSRVRRGFEALRQSLSADWLNSIEI